MMQFWAWFGIAGCFLVNQLLWYLALRLARPPEKPKRLHRRDTIKTPPVQVEHKIHPTRVDKRVDGPEN